MIEHSESVETLARALAKAQGEVENANKNAINPHFKNHYADLAEIINTVRPVLNKHGLSVVQIPGFGDGVVTVDTMLLHESGEWLRGTSGSPAQKQDPQGVGSAITYLRRYSLAALCGIAQEDDDGQAASQPRSNGNATQAPAPNVPAADGKSRQRLAGLVETLDRAGLQGEATEHKKRALALVMDGGPQDKVNAAIAWAESLIRELEAAA